MTRLAPLAIPILTALVVLSACSSEGTPTASVPTPAPTATPDAADVEPVGQLVGNQFVVPTSTVAPLIIEARTPEEIDAPGVEVGIIDTPEPPPPTPLPDDTGPVTAPDPDPATCDLWINIPADVVNFAYNSAEIRAEGVAYLTTLAEVFAEAREVHVVGHASSDGDDASNQILSEKRAAAVAAILADSFAEDVQISAEGRGETEPIATNETPEGRAANRRVELILEVPDTTCDELETS